MAREKLSREFAAKIDKHLPDLIELQKSTLLFQPDLISLGTGLNSPIPIAAVCLQDLTCTLQEAKYALFEAYAHIAWYREIKESPEEENAIFFGKFFADDAALRLYAAGEHFANSIINMLEIESALRLFKQSNKAKKKSTSSAQAIVGLYLKENFPAHEITKAIQMLSNSNEWKEVSKYRNAWVHSKPPIVEGAGLSYQRKNRLKRSDNWIGISFGGGDPSEYTIDSLVETIKEAMHVFTDATKIVVLYYQTLLREKVKNTL